jgi:hypothetical protein
MLCELPTMLPLMFIFPTPQNNYFSLFLNLQRHPTSNHSLTSLSGPRRHTPIGVPAPLLHLCSVSHSMEPFERHSSILASYAISLSIGSSSLATSMLYLSPNLPQFCSPVTILPFCSLSQQISFVIYSHHFQLSLSFLYWL